MDTEAFQVGASDGAAAALEMRAIGKRFPGVIALDNVDLTLQAGKVHALMGENGAGKSTLIKIMTGVCARDCGLIRMRGRAIDIRSPRDSLRQGIKVVFQEIALIPEFSVAENIFLEQHPVKRGGAIDWRRIARDAAALFARIGFDVDPAARTGSLPVSKQQMVEIARALVHEARVVVMDEPTSSLTPNEVALLFAVIRRLTAFGIAVVYVSHKIDEVFQIADTVTVLRDGRHVSTKAIAGHSSESLIEDMIGRRIDTLFARQRGGARSTVALSVQGLGTARKLRGLSFHAHAGEVLGFFGLMGAGRTELAKAIVGYDPISAGTITIDGQPLAPHNTHTGVRLGIGLLTEDRKTEGLMAELPVYQNASLAALGMFAKLGFVDGAGERRAVQQYVERFRIKTPGLFQQIKNLSGGNQRQRSRNGYSSAAQRPAPQPRGAYPVLRSIGTRWGDNDVYDHVNNVVYYSWFDTAVNAYLTGRGLLDIHGGVTIGLVVETHCNFFAPLAFPQTVEAGLRVAHLGASSVRYEVGLFAQGASLSAAAGHLVHVYVARASRRPVPLPAALRSGLQAQCRVMPDLAGRWHHYRAAARRCA